MFDVYINTVLVLIGIGAFSAIMLAFVAKYFNVIEDPRIDEIEKILPGANCGGCGYPGCRNFAENIVKADNFESLFCPVGGNESMKKAASIMGKVATEKAPLVAVVRCSGSYENRPKTNIYDGVVSCKMASALYLGDTECPNGCLGCGDCVVVCKFDAIHMDKVTGLPIVDDSKCTACGACVKACPRNIIELRKKWPKDRKIFVSCMNKEKGGIAKKYCKVACTGCTKCFKACPHEAIKIENNLAFIDSNKCKLCRKCVLECPTSAILEVNFPARKTEETRNETIEPTKIS